MRKTFLSAALLLTGTTLVISLSPATAQTLQYGDLSPDGQYMYQGPQAGWYPAPHKLERKVDRWVHTDALSHDAPRPILAPRVSRGTTQEATASD